MDNEPCFEMLQAREAMREVLSAEAPARIAATALFTAMRLQAVMGAVMSHLLQEHGVEDPVQNMTWMLRDRPPEVLRIKPFTLESLSEDLFKAQQGLSAIADMGLKLSIPGMEEYVEEPDDEPFERRRRRRIVEHENARGDGDGDDASSDLGLDSGADDASGDV